MDKIKILIECDQQRTARDLMRLVTRSGNTGYVISAENFDPDA